MAGLLRRALREANELRWSLRLGRFGERAVAIRLGAKLRSYQISEVVTLRRFIDMFAIDCIFDVGANAGQYARMLRDECGYKGTILSFEPHPREFETLSQAAEADARWHCYSVALTDHDGTIPFHIMAASQFSSILTPSPDQAAMFDSMNAVAERIDVPCRRLDSWFEELRAKHGFERPFLKMDTQGHDLAVLKGATGVHGLLMGLQTELSLQPLYEGSTNYRDMLDYCEASGFALSALVPNNEGHFPRLFEVDAILARKDLVDEQR